MQRVETDPAVNLKAHPILCTDWVVVILPSMWHGAKTEVSFVWLTYNQHVHHSNQKRKHSGHAQVSAQTRKKKKKAHITSAWKLASVGSTLAICFENFLWHHCCTAGAFQKTQPESSSCSFTKVLIFNWTTIFSTLWGSLKSLIYFFQWCRIYSSFVTDVVAVLRGTQRSVKMSVCSLQIENQVGCWCKNANTASV